jgi:hypothetical protein
MKTAGEGEQHMLTRWSWNLNMYVHELLIAYLLDLWELYTGVIIGDRDVQSVSCVGTINTTHCF